MRKVAYHSYFLLALLLFCMMSFSEETTESLRSATVSSLSPCWKAVNKIKSHTLCFLSGPFWLNHPIETTNELELEQLKQENQILRTQIESVREWLLNEDRLQEQLKRLIWLNRAGSEESKWSAFFQRRGQELCELLALQVVSVPAQVIFREPSSWSSSVWLNIGEQDNIRLGKHVICKNSPVLSGTSIVGIVEYVGSCQSRVRLITDSRLRPSVRSVRGNEQNRHLTEQMDTLLFALEIRQDLFSSHPELEGLICQLKQLHAILTQQSEGAYLAKGELFGSSGSLWRSRSRVLKGLGFNYDFPDLEGPSRDLRTGIAYSSRSEPISILRPGDLLLTTGFDGVFPLDFALLLYLRLSS
jgi:rod shape-determining protein MreC